MGFANWYDEHVVPRLIRCACSGPAIMKLREQVVPLASGAVFELGCGGGLNQRFYDPARISSYAGVDPSAKGLEFARAEAERKGRLPEPSDGGLDLSALRVCGDTPQTGRSARTAGQAAAARAASMAAAALRWTRRFLRRRPG